MAEKRGLGTQLRALIATLDGDVQGLYDECGVAFRPRFYPVVQYLLRSGAARVNDIAAEIGVSQPAATQTIAEMTKHGLLTATQGPDGRERLISLTPQSLNSVDKLEPLWRAIEGAARELNSELPVPLPEVIGATFKALHRESFIDRVRRRLDND